MPFFSMSSLFRTTEDKHDGVGGGGGGGGLSTPHTYGPKYKAFDYLSMEKTETPKLHTLDVLHILKI